MALGDYEKTIYVNGQAPGISAQNLNRNENKTEELDTTLAAHLAEKATETDGIHGLRVNNGELEYWSGTEWINMGSVIQPTKPMSADLYEGSATAGSYYTILDVANGKGSINRISVASMYNEDNNKDLRVKITVDGTLFTLPTSIISAPLRVRGIQRDSATIGAREFDYFGKIFFNTSIKIELGHVTTGKTFGLHGSVDYSLV